MHGVAAGVGHRAGTVPNGWVPEGGLKASLAEPAVRRTHDADVLNDGSWLTRSVSRSGSGSGASRQWERSQASPGTTASTGEPVALWQSMFRRTGRPAPADPPSGPVGLVPRSDQATHPEHRAPPDDYEGRDVSPGCGAVDVLGRLHDRTPDTGMGQTAEALARATDHAPGPHRCLRTGNRHDRMIERTGAASWNGSQQ
jgi:hypothetical protein